jgi:hypothetical protein
VVPVGVTKTGLYYISKNRFPTSTTDARPLGSSHSFRYRLLPAVILVRACVHSLSLSLGLLTAMFGTAGTLMNVSKRGQNLGKARAHSPSDTAWN